MLSNSQNIRSPRNRPFNSAAGRQRQGTTYFLLLIGDASFLLLLLGVLLVVV
jgi:4-hydroxybenzoate polyprenyltransferase